MKFCFVHFLAWLGNIFSSVRALFKGATIILLPQIFKLRRSMAKCRGVCRLENNLALAQQLLDSCSNMPSLIKQNLPYLIKIKVKNISFSQTIYYMKIINIDCLKNFNPGNY
ncbi:hypothetical protein BpHYR1_050270 [Brachionus plicatilis]|uniref:Uncharacterized protein n=1 Tax=Brachionus plicatilis TaxID=10195 RepID=A0A3M7RVA5_BRAPC|nr:hypothetical protein BpHYR1_050270 [Brachionus plicatilis]